MEANPYKVFAGSQGEHLAKGICDYLGCPMGKVRIDHFSDGEFAASFDESVRGMSVYLVQSTRPSSDNLMELLLMIDAAKRASAYKVVAVIPYFGWARQDRKDKPRVSIGAKLVANMLQVAVPTASSRSICMPTRFRDSSIYRWITSMAPTCWHPMWLD